ncbi:hypothetical protein [Geodermatophilus sp. CPCC 205761]|uniref:hypothetical protein n=1 Tax=Geodermatophilus sp. CPCC 205761 TaxID=2936597 RepID=UPI003EEE70B3
MPRDRDDAMAGHGSAGSSVLRTVGLVVGFLLAVGATVVVFVTDDPQVLRLAVVGAAWAFVLAALAASRRGPGNGADRDDVGRVADDRAATRTAAAERAAERERAAAEREREAAARRETEQRRENDARREAERAMRAELAALRGELGQVADLRRDVADVAGLRGRLAEVAELRGELAEVPALRRDLAGLAELRAGLAQLQELRGDLAQLAELRADVGRLRAELTEQLSGEMLIERIMLRTQSTRTGPSTAESPATRTIEAVSWGEPSAELTAAAPAVSLDDLTGGTRQFTALPAEEPRPEPAYAATPPPPRDWLAQRSLVEPEAPAAPEVTLEPRRRHTDDPFRAAPVDQPTEQRPVAQRERPPVPSWSALAEPAPSPVAEPGEGSSRLAEILAEGGVSPSSGGRRRRRYRDDDESDDVLSRVLGRNG